MFTRALIISHCVAVSAAAAIYTVTTCAQEAKAPTYTAEQAQRGEMVVTEHCVECHGELLQGTEGPALKGGSFMKWLTARDLGSVFTKIRDTMPVDAEDSVSDEDKLDALAYLLQVNGVPEGDTELPPDIDAMSKMRVPPNATAGLQPGATIETTGCLQKGPGSEWVLSVSANGGTPARSWRLLNVFPAPTAHVSHTVKVTGLLVKDATGDALNTTSLTMVPDTCAK
jgi:mono/diheme cytochrome c family protein